MNKKLIKQGIIFGLFAVLSACKQPAQEAVPPRPALVINAGASSYGHPGMVLVGEVKSRYESNIAFRVAGKINSRKVDVGAAVKKGQVLAVIDANDANLSVQAASADILAAEANHALAKAELDRQRQLYEKKFISKSALDIREAEFKTSSARLKQVKSQAAISGNQSKYTQLIADRDGVVAQINAEPGQVVAAGQMVAQIVDYQHLEVLVAVPESRMANMQIGRQVLVKLWADSEKSYQGVVREVAPAANSATRAFDVRVAIPNPDAEMRIGMTAGVSFDTGAMDKLIVPSTAVTQINGQQTVWVISKQGIAQPRAVQLGQFTEQGVEVLAGLKMGEQIAIAGVHTLVKGQQVKPKLVQLTEEGTQ